MLHFPSTNSAAHRPADRDVARLHAQLDDDVWAFTNCRVDAPGYPVAEIDWFFYNTRTGALLVSEWKNFKKPVFLAADAGQRWELTNGTEVANPIEQVAKQQYAVREALARDILPSYFPESAEARVGFSVYSPQISQATRIDRLRFGKVFGSLDDLGKAVQKLSSIAPLLLPDDDGARLSLARAFCALFRCSMSSEVEEKLSSASPLPKARVSRAAVVNRISEIHREIARLHSELAELTLALERVPTVTPPRAPVAPTAYTAGVELDSAPSVEAITVPTELDGMKAHLRHEFSTVNGSAGAAKSALSRAWIAVLRDSDLRRANGISFAVFGSAATPLVKVKHESVRKLVGMQLGKWCFEEAQKAGLNPRKVAGAPSLIRVN